MIRHFLSLGDAGGDALAAMLSDALDRKEARAGQPRGKPDRDAPLAGRVLATIFEKPSTRTRVSFDIAMRQLGGSTIVLDAAGTQLGRGETIADTARVLSRYVDAIALRTDDHAKLEEFAEHATVPVVNGLTDLSHPCQLAADLLTVVERGKALPGLCWAWLGDANNMLHSLIEAAWLLRMEVAVACPEAHAPGPALLREAEARGLRVRVTRDAREAVDGADVVATDTWISMGQEGSAQAAKLAAMRPYQVTEELMARARADALFLHCLPAHRGEEVVNAVLDGPASAVWDEAENRVHAQKSILLWCFGELA